MHFDWRGAQAERCRRTIDELASSACIQAVSITFRSWWLKIIGKGSVFVGLQDRQDAGGAGPIGWVFAAASHLAVVIIARTLARHGSRRSAANSRDGRSGPKAPCSCHSICFRGNLHHIASWATTIGEIPSEMETRAGPVMRRRVSEVKCG